jgi:glucokinase
MTEHSTATSLGSTDPVLAIDIGGTKIAVGVIDSDGIVITSDRGPTLASPDDDAEAIWDRLHELCERVLERAGGPALQGVGVGCGGPMTWPHGAVSPLNMPAWRGFPLRSRLRKAYPGLPVRVHNDAIAVVVAEHWKGAGRGVPNMLGMVVSTGVGGGLVLGGRLIDGATGNAGHVGHIVVDPDGPLCGCGGHGCVEAIARGPALAEWAHAQGWRANDPAATARELADDARAGDKLAVAAFERAGRAVGMGIASAVATCDVSRIVVGGGISQVGPLLFDPLEDAFREYARMDFTKGATVGAASLDQNAGIVGAAAFILAGDRYWSAD